MKNVKLGKLKRMVNKARKVMLQDMNFHTRSVYWAQRKRYKMLIKEKKKQAFRNLHTKLLLMQHNKPKDFWNLINTNKNVKATYPQHTIECEQFYSHFKSLHHNIVPPIASDSLWGVPYIPELDGCITQTEVAFAIRSLKCNKAPGEDGIPAETYKEINNQLLDLLTSIFNRILISGEYPEVWSEGIICPIYKAGERTDPRNYRGITLLNCIAKIFTSILHTRLSEWAEDNNVIPEEQFGF